MSCTHFPPHLTRVNALPCWTQMSKIGAQRCNYKPPVSFQTTYLAHNKKKCVLFSRIISLHNSSFQNCQNLCSCPVFGSEFSKKTVSMQCSVSAVVNFWSKSYPPLKNNILMKMQTKIYHLLYIFSVEYFTGLTCKPQNNQIMWRLSNWWCKCEQSETNN